MSHKDCRGPESFDCGATRHEPGCPSWQEGLVETVEKGEATFYEFELGEKGRRMMIQLLHRGKMETTDDEEFDFASVMIDSFLREGEIFNQYGEVIRE